MSLDIQQTILPRPAYYVMDMRDDCWVQISELYFNLEEAKQAYSRLLKDYPFARLGGSKESAVTDNG